MPFWGFLQSKFDAMPVWVRVSTYLVLLLLLVYLYLTPRFVSGQIVARTDSGGLVPYRGVAIQTQVAGHTLKFNTNEDGFWTIPIVDRRPMGIKLQVFHEDDQSWFPVTIDAGDVWTRDFRIVVSADEPFVALEYAALEPALREGEVQTAGFSGLLVGPARAGALEYQPESVMRGAPTAAGRQPAAPTAASAARPETALLDEVRRVVAKITRRPLATIGPDFELKAASGVGYVQRIQIVEGLERAAGIRIPDEHWRNLDSVREFARYLADRKELEARYNLPKELSRGGNWPQIQQQIPSQERPRFKR